MNDGNSFLERLKNWQKGYLVVIVGVPSAIIAVSLISSLILPVTSQPLALVGLAAFLVIFGIFGGYLAKNEYLMTFIYSILTVFLVVVLISALTILFGGGLFGLGQSSDPFSSIFISFMFAGLFGIGVSLICSIFLLPSLLVGFLINRMISKKDKSGNVVI